MRIVGEIDNTHRAASDLAFDFVTPDLRHPTNIESGRWRANRNLAWPSPGSGIAKSTSRSRLGPILKLSVVIPVFNEKGTLEELLRRIALVLIPMQIVIVDDASTDGTRERLVRLEEEF